MEGFCFARCRFTRLMAAMQLGLGVFVMIFSMVSLHRFYTTHSLLPGGLDVDPSYCAKFQTTDTGYASFDIRALADRVDDVLVQLADLQDKLEATALKVAKKTKKSKRTKRPPENMTMPEFRRFLEDEVIHPLYSAHIALRLIRIPRPADPDDGDGATVDLDPLVNFFTAEETRKYVTAKRSRRDGGGGGVYGTNRTYSSVGHACVLMRRELDEYMSYDVGARCPDDWDLAQRLMLAGCDPLPRRRCLAPASKLAHAPLPINASLWTLPDDGNVRWTRYHCRSYKCLSARNPRRGYDRCVGCFDMDMEKQRWVNSSAANRSAAAMAEFSVEEVLAAKPGEVRIGLDMSVGTGSFAARMRERGVTVVSAAMNLGAPFAETIALRGLVPLYVTVTGQRLPLFDNTMDLVHTAGLLDEGWVDLQLLDFVLFDWDRVLRPGGLLWVDKFACARKDLDDYMYMFLQFRYKKHRWVVSFKNKDQVYLSALLEKPPSGYDRCVDCFDIDMEKWWWVSSVAAVANRTAAATSSTSLADFSVDEVLAVKPGEVRIGLDMSMGTGSFAARMRERGVTVVSTAMNLGAPFAETIALWGLVPLYVTVSGQRLPLFDNTMDLVHTTGLLEGWVDLQLLDFMLWVGKFACAGKDLNGYMYMFLQFRYKKHRWVVSFKNKDEVYLSALLEKPPRS